MTDHLPLTLGEHTTASGPVTFTRIGKHGKWAYNHSFRWLVATGECDGIPVLNITGRVEPAPTVMDDPSPKRIWAWGNGKILVYCAAVEPSNRSTVEYVRADTVAPVQLEHSRRERDKLHSQVDRLKHDRDAGAVDYCALMWRYDAMQVDLARVTTERDEAVALLRRWVEWHDAEPNSGMPKNGTRAFLAKIGEKPAEASNSQSDIFTAHDALLALGGQAMTARTMARATNAAFKGECGGE